MAKRGICRLSIITDVLWGIVNFVGVLYVTRPVPPAPARHNCVLIIVCAPPPSPRSISTMCDCKVRARDLEWHCALPVIAACAPPFSSCLPWCVIVRRVVPGGFCVKTARGGA